MTCPQEQEYEQTLFLGCSIQNYKCSLGWNEQPSTLTARLVRDDCAGAERVYYDLTSPVPRKTTTAADPGFFIYGDSGDSAPEIGAPCYFRYGGFEFCGLLQSWNQVDINSDTEIIDVNLASPTELLQGVNVILSDYAGDVRGFNVINAYGFQEYANGNECTTFTQDPVDGPVFGSIANGFGGADATEAGMPWTKVRDAISVLTSATPNAAIFEDIKRFSAYGRAAFVGAARHGYGLLPRDDINIAAGGLFAYAKDISYYLIDISSIPVANIDYRIPGATSDILTIINQVCQDLAHDYYIELVPVYTAGGVMKVIKFRTVSRINQPSTNALRNFIALNKDNGRLVDSSYGLELRNESTTTFLIGGQKRSLYQVTNGNPLPGTDPDQAYFEANNLTGYDYIKDTIVPFYGKDDFGNINIVKPDNTIDISLRSVRTSLNLLGQVVPDVVNVPIQRIDDAGIGYDAWLKGMLAETGTGSLAEALSGISPVYGSLTRSPIEDVLVDLETGNDASANVETQYSARDSIKTFNRQQTGDQITEDLRKLYTVFSDIYDNTLNTVMVRMPYTCAKYEDGRLVTTDTPVDGGWTETSSILGLPNPSGPIDYFKNSDGTVHSIAQFEYNSGLNVSALGDSKYYFNDLSDEESAPSGYFYTEVNPRDEIVFVDRANAISPRVLVDVPNLGSVLNKGNIDAINDQLAENEINQAFREPTQGEIEADYALVTSLTRPYEPLSMAIAFESRENTYGPWKPDNIIEAGPPGRINVQKDESLVPWTYGSYANMNLVAQTKANDSVGGMNAGESGSITVEGTAEIPLGAEVSSVVQYYEGRGTLDQNITINGINYTIPYINSPAWDGSSGPNVTAIAIQNGREGVQTTYNFRTYTPRFGTLNKAKASQLSNRLKDQNKLESRMRYLRSLDQVTAANLQKAIGRNKDSGSGGRVNKVKQQRDTPNNITEAMPGSTIVGAARTFDTTKEGASNVNIKQTRNIVAQKNIHATAADTENSGYDQKAMMSWDGFMRPVSLSGSGKLPRMIVPQETGTYDTGNSASNTIHNRYLNFLANPSGHGFDELSYLHTGNSGVGHDIEIIARKTFAEYTGMTGTGQSASIVMPANVESGKLKTDYADDYRFMALRGPLMVQSWGYDTDGKPVPNEVDTTGNMCSGIYETENLSNRFFPNWLKQSETWPVAPVDLRLDRERGVWVTNGGGGTPMYSLYEFMMTVLGISGMARQHK